MNDISKNSNDKPVRIQFEFTARMARELERMEEESELPTHREFFANTLALWRWAAQKSAEGKTIAAVDISDDGMKYVELNLPALDFIRCNSLAAKTLANQGISAPQVI